MRERGLSDAELARALRDVGAHLAYPQTRDLVPAVLARLGPAEGQGFWRSLWSPRLAFVPALATAALLALVTVAFQPAGVRAAEALGLRGLFIFRVAQTPAPPTLVPAPSVSPGGILSDARRVTSVDAASAELGFTVLVPAALGDPDEVYVVADRQQAVLVYRPRPGVPESAQTGVGALVTEVRARWEPAFLAKTLGPGTTAEPLTIEGDPAVWISGAPHQVLYLTPSGSPVADTLRLAGNVILREHGGVLLRVEASVGRDEALRIAGSFR